MIAACINPEAGSNTHRATADLQVRLEQLQQDYQELEMRFRERTAELEQANTALQESEQRFRIALVDTPIVVYNQDADLRYTWIYNPQAYADQPVLGKTDAELFSPEDAERLAALKKRVMAAGQLVREVVPLTVGGRKLFYDMTLDPLHDVGGVVAGLTCAATNITERKQIEDELRQMIVEHVRLQRQAEQLAVIEERQRLARELHDSVTQALYSMTLYADAARIAFMAQNWTALEKNLHEVRSMAREAMYDMRLLVFELRPFMLEKEGLIPALRARLAAVEGRSGLKIDVRVDGERRLPLGIEEGIYRIVQEGLNNVVKHARAREVWIDLKFAEDNIQLELIDDGSGFNMLAAEESGGIGLRSIEERVQQMGGSLEIKSELGQGTHLTARIPIQDADLSKAG